MRSKNIFQSVLPMALMVLACFAAYGNSLHGPFIFDDHFAILNNITIRSLFPLAKFWHLPKGMPLSGRPISDYTFALNYAIGQFDTFSYHLLNLMLHIGSAWVLFKLIRVTLNLKPFEWISGREQTMAFFTACLWALHPIQTESVTYITQRTELLVGFFYFLTMFFFAKSLLVKRPVFYRAAAVLACALGMGSKEVMAACPILVLFYDRIFSSDSWRSVLSARKKFYFFLFSTWGILFLLALQSPHVMSVRLNYQSIEPWQYLLTQPQAVFHYLRLSIWPSPLVIDYSGWPLVKSWSEAAPCLTAVLVLLAASGWGVFKARWWGFLGAWFFLILAPSSSVIPIMTEIVAERRMHLPLLSVAVLLMVFILYITKRSKPLFVIVSLVLCAALGAGTWIRNQDYKTEESIWTDVIRKRPQNPRALNALGLLANHAKNYPLGETYIRQSMALVKTPLPETLAALAISLAGQGKIEEAEDVFSRIIDTDLSIYRAEALAIYHYDYAKLMHIQGRDDKAEEHYLKAFKFDPLLLRALFNLGLIYADQGKIEKAKRVFKYIIRRPASQLGPYKRLILAKASFELSQLALKQGRRRDALLHLRRALMVDRDYQDARLELQRLEAVSSDSAPVQKS